MSRSTDLYRMEKDEKQILTLQRKSVSVFRVLVKHDEKITTEQELIDELQHEYKIEKEDIGNCDQIFSNLWELTFITIPDSLKSHVVTTGF